MTTNTFLTILAWPMAFYAILMFCLFWKEYLKMNVKPKGWVVFILGIISLWWLLTKGA